MLFIENYQEAKYYHYKVIKCWMVKKLYEEKDRDFFKCDLENCLSCSVCYYDDLCDESRSFVRKNLEILLSGDHLTLISFYEDNEGFIKNLKKKECIGTFFKSAYLFFQKKYGEHFLNLLGKNTCIYCNRNYTLSMIKGRSRAELDHWIPKSLFPFFSVSFFNLIPSCHTCNHLKGNGPKNGSKIEHYKELPNPYNKIDMFKFSYIFKSLNKIGVAFKDAHDKEIQHLLLENKIGKIYSSHDNFELRELYQLAFKYPENYLKKLIKDTFNFQISEEEKFRLIFGVEKNENDYHKRPLSKFKNEIIRELLSIEN